MFRKILSIICLVGILMVGLTACGDNVPVENYVIDNKKYETREKIENEKQLINLNRKEDIYASIYFIESPRGTKYKVTWYLDGKIIKEEEKEMITDTHGCIVYKLEKNYLSKGKLKMKISGHNRTILEKEVEIE